MVPTPSGSNRWVVELRKFRQTIAERALVAEKDFGLVKKHLARCERDTCVLTEPTPFIERMTEALTAPDASLRVPQEQCRYSCEKTCRHRHALPNHRRGKNLPRPRTKPRITHLR